jgi:hypothetical protein
MILLPSFLSSIALPSVVSIASDRNYSYPVRLEELFSEHIVTGRGESHGFEKDLHIADL